jgi:Na+/alanine symporter
LGFRIDSSGYICAIVFGVKRIAKFTEFIVPNMAMDILVLVIIAIDFDQLLVL